MSSSVTHTQCKIICFWYLNKYRNKQHYLFNKDYDIWLRYWNFLLKSNFDYILNTTIIVCQQCLTFTHSLDPTTCLLNYFNDISYIYLKKRNLALFAIRCRRRSICGIYCFNFLNSAVIKFYNVLISGMSATQHIVVGNTKRRKENSPALFLNEFIVFCHLSIFAILIVLEILFVVT